MPRKLLVIKFPSDGRYDADEVGSWLCEVQKVLEPKYQIIAVPEDFEIYCPDKDDCLTICKEMLDVVCDEDRQEIVKRLEVKYLTPKGEDE